jgi:hypothetical protein
MKHFATPQFWECYARLPETIQQLADKNYLLLKENPAHPSLHFKQMKTDFRLRIFDFRLGHDPHTASRRRSDRAQPIADT